MRVELYLTKPSVPAFSPCSPFPTCTSLGPGLMGDTAAGRSMSPTHAMVVIDIPIQTQKRGHLPHVIE
jgi:hypothetical protein